MRPRHAPAQAPDGRARVFGGELHEVRTQNRRVGRGREQADGGFRTAVKAHHLQAGVDRTARAEAQDDPGIRHPIPAVHGDPRATPPRAPAGHGPQILPGGHGRGHEPCFRLRQVGGVRRPVPAHDDGGTRVGVRRRKQHRGGRHNRPLLHPGPHAFHRVLLPAEHVRDDEDGARTAVLPRHRTRKQWIMRPAPGLPAGGIARHRYAGRRRDLHLGIAATQHRVPPPPRHRTDTGRAVAATTLTEPP